MRLIDRLIRKARPRQEPEPIYTVQLHRLEREGEWPGCLVWRIVYSWRPIEVRGLQAARAQAHELRQSNRWASANATPEVTITDRDGVRYSE